MHLQSMLWDSLNEDNKVSLFVRYIDIATGKYETKIINRITEKKIIKVKRQFPFEMDEFEDRTEEIGMKELELKYGCNPNQKPSRIYMEDGSELPIKVLSGRPGYINFLDAFNGWQLVRESEKSNRTSGSHFLQACFSGRSSNRTSADRDPGKDLLGRRHELERAFPSGLRLCPCQRC